jgi:hypothetical protein
MQSSSSSSDFNLSAKYYEILSQLDIATYHPQQYHSSMILYHVQHYFMQCYNRIALEKALYSFIVLNRSKLYSTFNKHEAALLKQQELRLCSFANSYKTTSVQNYGIITNEIDNMVTCIPIQQHSTVETSFNSILYNELINDILIMNVLIPCASNNSFDVMLHITAQGLKHTQLYAQYYYYATQYRQEMEELNRLEPLNNEIFKAFGISMNKKIYEFVAFNNK